MTDPTALLIIDVQLGMFDPAFPVYEGAALLEKINSLVARARAAGAPVIYIQHLAAHPDDPIHPSKPGFVIHPELDRRPGDRVIQKTHPNSFQETSLQAELEALDVHQLVICGIQTEMCVDTSCRRAYSLGYKVTLASDAHSTWDDSGLSVAQIIAHHNENLGGWFVKALPAGEIEFSKE